MDAHYRRAVAMAAIERVLAGARPADLESDVLDFKEEQGTHQHDRRQPIPAQYEPAARALADEAACFANTDHGGILVVGVQDDVPGPSAFVGAYLDTMWLRERIHAFTQPPLSVDVIEEIEVTNRRIYLVQIPPALEEIRCNGRLRARIGRGCRELTGNDARRFLESRRRYDWSAEASGFHLRQVDPRAMKIARESYRAETGRALQSDLDAVSKLGLVAVESPPEDPELTRAGALLLCPFEPEIALVDLMAVPVEGAPSHRRIERRAPLLVALDDAWEFLEQCYPPTPVVVGVQRRELRTLPVRAFREAIVNAVMHRDYRQTHGRVVVHVIGEPSTVLKVRSPGLFPPGVPANRLLTTPSRPRNPNLADALHRLGLAEREGIGIDTMYLEMLRDGHVEPTIEEDAGDVICILNGGRVDLDVRAFFDQLARSHPQLGEDVRAHLAITNLLRMATVRPESLAEHAQCMRAEALESLIRLEDARVVDRLVNRSQTFRLAATAREQLRRQLAYQQRASIDDQWDLIRAYLDTNPDISREAASQLLGVSSIQASRILSALCRERQLLELAGPQRGRGVRYRLAVAGSEG